MIQKEIVKFLRSRVGRVLMASLGLGVIAVLLHHIGWQNVLHSMRRVAWTVPLVIAIDFTYFTCEVIGLRALYGSDRHRLPISELIRASLIGHTVAMLVPMGKPVGEGVKASMFARWTGGARAVAAMARFQGVVLLVNTMICVPIGIAALWLAGPGLLPLAIAGNAVITLVVGGGILLVGRHTRIGDWVGKKVTSAEHFGPAIDKVLQSEPLLPMDAIAWCFLARVIQCGEYIVMLYAMSGSVTVARGLTALGIALVGSALGEILPNALGATEANFAYFAPLLSLSRGDALTIPLITHLSVLLWAMVGAIVPVFWNPLPAGPTDPDVAATASTP